MARETINSVNINGMEVSAHFLDSEQGFHWRLESGRESSSWEGFYQGIHTHTFSNGRTFGLLTDYWRGRLPTEVPFEIILAK